MANSDVKSNHIVADTTAASNTSVAGASQPDTDFTLVSEPVEFTDARIVTATTAGSGDSGKTVTITGTDLNGNTVTDTITLPGSATTTSGTVYFKTVTAASMSAQPAANVSLGNAADAAEQVYAGRARLRGAFIVNSGTAGTVVFRNGGSNGDIYLQLGTVGSATAERDVSIPDQGILFEDGIYVTYTGGTSAIFTNMTIFRS